MKNKLTIFALAVFSLLPSCKQPKHELPPQPINIIVLVDFSISRDTSVVAWYKETITHALLQKMGRHDKITILPVDFNSKTSANEIFKVNFSKNNYSNEYGGLQKNELERQNHLDSVNSAVHQFSPAFDAARVKRANLKQGTDIFGALSLCVKYEEPGYRNLVVIFSDMLQCTDKKTWNFEDRLNTEKDVEHYLAVAEKTDLQGMDIIVLTGAQNNMRREKFNLVTSFWEKYFTQKSNATLIDYSSGAVEKLEDQFEIKTIHL